MSDWLEIHALADNELDAESEAEARKAVEGSPAAASEYRSVQTVKETLASKAVQAEVSDAWKKCRGRLDEIDKTHRAESFVGRFSWALSGLFVVALVSTAIYNRTVNPRSSPHRRCGSDGGGFSSAVFLEPGAAPRHEHMGEELPRNARYWQPQGHGLRRGALPGASRGHDSAF